ncbi:MAG: hypothetical protein ACRD9W_05150, partial [Terriglobia bacterium]
SNGIMRVKDVRHANLLGLIAQFGTIAELARRAGVVANVLAQIKGGKPMGAKFANKLELGMGKPSGRMDSLQFASADDAMGAAEIAQMMTVLPPEDREALLKHARLLVKNLPAGTAANPFGDIPKPPRPRTGKRGRPAKQKRPPGKGTQ